MESGKKNFFAKTWKRCRSFQHKCEKNNVGVEGLVKSKSWSGKESTKKKKTTPDGFFPVCVGPERQRFAVKMKYANHPLFTMLLEDAETEFGYNCDGPISLACDVDLFYKVLVEMKGEDVQPLGRRFGYGSCSPFINPSRRFGCNRADQMGKGYGSYEALTSSNLIKMN